MRISKSKDSPPFTDMTNVNRAYIIALNVANPEKLIPQELTFFNDYLIIPALHCPKTRANGTVWLPALQNCYN